jgi:hypothetical protein
MTSARASDLRPSAEHPSAAGPNDALYAAELPFFATPAAPVRPRLHGELRRLADELALPAVASVTMALMERTRPACGAGARPHRDVTAISGRLAAAFALAVDAGELDTAPDPESFCRGRPPETSGS